MAHSHHAHRAHHVSKSRAKHILGHKRGGGVGSEAHGKAIAKKMGRLAHEMERHEAAEMHGHKGKGRLDKRARGGGVKGKHHTQVNVIVAPHKGSPSLGAGAPAGPGALPPAPPPGGPPMAPPPGAGGMPPMKRGGRTYKRGGGVKMTAGADSGEGRLQKARAIRKH